MSTEFHKHNKGFTLIELMIVVAIIAILGAVAIPAYNSYVDEASVSAARGNLDTMRIFVEDHRLENGQLPATGVYVNAAINGEIGWTNENVGTHYDFTLNTDQAAGTYDVWIVSRNQYDSNGNIIWVRCQNNFQTCCTSLDAGAGVGAAAAAAACPP